MSSAKVQDILAFVFFFNGFWFFFSKIGKYTMGLVLLVVESCWQSPCSVFTILGCLYTASVNVGIAPTVDESVLSLAAPTWGLRLTSEVSPTDLLVNCAMTRSTNLSISCHISNVDCNRPPSLCIGHGECLAGLCNRDDNAFRRQTGFLFEWNGERKHLLWES